MFLFGRYTGLVTGTSELDPLRWPGSKWKCLVVRILYRALSIYLFFFFFFGGSRAEHQLLQVTEKCFWRLVFINFNTSMYYSFLEQDCLPTLPVFKPIYVVGANAEFPTL